MSERALDFVDASLIVFAAVLFWACLALCSLGLTVIVLGWVARQMWGLA